MTTSMAESSILCQSCSNTSFVSPLIESTMVNNCTQLGLNCPIGQIVTVGYMESYYYYNNNYTYYYNYVEGVNRTIYIQCSNDTLYHPLDVMNNPIIFETIVSFNCTDCWKTCANYKLNTTNPNGLNRPIDAVNVTLYSGFPCSLAIACQSLNANFTMMFSDGTNITSVNYVYGSITVTCQSNGSLLYQQYVYDPNIYQYQYYNKTLVGYYCSGSECDACSQLAITESNILGMFDGVGYINFGEYSNDGTNCLDAYVECGSYLGGQVSIIADDFIYLSSNSSLLQASLFCNNNGSWMIYSVLDQNWHPFSKIYCVVASPTQQCATCSNVSPMTNGISDGLSAFVYASTSTGCGLAVMFCVPPMINLDSQVSIIADGQSYSTGIGVASVLLTCDANSTWQINNVPKSVEFNSISCLYTALTCKSCPDIEPLATNTSGNIDGTTTTIYNIDAASGCRTATMTCSTSNTTNQASITVDNDAVFFNGQSSNSVSMICASSGTQWNIIGMLDPLPFTTIQCLVS